MEEWNNTWRRERLGPLFIDHYKKTVYFVASAEKFINSSIFGGHRK